MFREIFTLAFSLVLIFSLGITGAMAQQQGTAQGGTAVTPARTTIAPSNQTAPVGIPREFVLTDEQQKYLDQVLGYWEFRSEKVQTYACTFQRWEYNPSFVRDPNTPWTIAEGEIKYAKPDKGMYKVEKVSFYTAPQAQGQQPEWKPREGNHGEHWVCDGKSIFEFNYLQEQLQETPLPPRMQGEAISDGPLPFLFGAKVSKLKQRYWLKPLVPPPASKGEYWLLAVPKTRADAANFHRVELILDQKDFLPKAMQIYVGDKERKVFQFSDRTVNPRRGLLERDFSKPATPRGWKKVVTTAGQPAARTATLPTEAAGRGRLPIPVPRRQQ